MKAKKRPSPPWEVCSGQGSYKVSVHTWSYLLNCQELGPIHGDKSEKPAMQMPIPKVSATVMAKFSWQLDTARVLSGGQRHGYSREQYANLPPTCFLRR